MRRRRRVFLLTPVLTGLVALAALGATGGDDYLVGVELEDAAGLRKNSEVQVGGVAVGKVRELSATENDDARAVLALSASAAPVGRDARAYVRSANVFGEKYIEVVPGDLRQSAPSGSVIPKQRTGAPVELDDLLDVLDTDTRQRLQILINETGAALAGRRQDFNALLVQLPGSLDRTAALMRELVSDNQALGELLERSDSVLAAVARERRSLGRLVDGAEGALSAFASRHRELGQTLREAPPTLVELQRTLGRLDELAEPLGPAARALRSTAPALEGALRELRPFERAAGPALAEARQVAPALRKLAREATPVLRELRPAASDLRVFARSLEPATETLDASFDDILGTLEGWARTTAVRDGLGHLFRAHLVLDEELITAGMSAMDEPAAASRQRSRKPRPQGSKETATERTPKRSNQPDDAPAGSSPLEALPELVPERQAEVPSRQTEALLDFLLAP